MDLPPSALPPQPPLERAAGVEPEPEKPLSGPAVGLALLLALVVADGSTSLVRWALLLRPYLTLLGFAKQIAPVVLAHAVLDAAGVALLASRARRERPSRLLGESIAIAVLLWTVSLAGAVVLGRYGLPFVGKPYLPSASIWVAVVAKWTDWHEVLARPSIWLLEAVGFWFLASRPRSRAVGVVFGTPAVLTILAHWIRDGEHFVTRDRTANFLALAAGLPLAVRFVVRAAHELGVHADVDGQDQDNAGAIVAPAVLRDHTTAARLALALVLGVAVYEVARPVPRDFAPRLDVGATWSRSRIVVERPDGEPVEPAEAESLVRSLLEGIAADPVSRTLARRLYGGLAVEVACVSSDESGEPEFFQAESAVLPVVLRGAVCEPGAPLGRKAAFVGLATAAGIHVLPSDVARLGLLGASGSRGREAPLGQHYAPPDRHALLLLARERLLRQGSVYRLREPMGPWLGSERDTPEMLERDVRELEESSRVWLAQLTTKR